MDETTLGNATKRLFREVIEGEALKWYGSVDGVVNADCPMLKAAFQQEFRKIDADSRLMSRLNVMMIKCTNTLRSYTQKIHDLIGKLTTPPLANMGY